MTTVLMAGGKVKPEDVPQAEAAVEKWFAAVHEAKPEGVRYASTRAADGVTFYAFLQLEDPDNNPLADLPEFGEFLKTLQPLVENAPPEVLTVVGSYRLFD